MVSSHTPGRPTRRQVLQTLGLTATAAALAACSSGKQKSPDQLTFWSHNGEMQELFKKTFAGYEKQPGGLPVELKYEPLKTMGQSLQLAWQSDQMPDIHTLAGLNLPPAALHEKGWFAPIDLGDAEQRLPAGSLIDGIHRFDGKTYSFPVVSFRQHWAPVWYRADAVSKLGLDPDAPPRTYDEFRAACRKAKKASGGKVFGWMSKLGGGDHMTPAITDLAQGAGFTGSFAGTDFRTGEYAFHSDAFVTAVEFLLSLHKDKLMFPGSVTIDGLQAQLRWAGGAAAYFFDGPWLPGMVKRQLAQKSEQLRVAPMLVPDSGTAVTAYRDPQQGNFWISSKSKHAEAASQLLREHFTTPEFFAGIASSSAVPANLDAVAKADVHPEYRKLVGWYQEQVFLAPSPARANPDVAKVLAKVRPVQPNYPDTLHGLFTGDLPDVRKALKQLSDNLSAERERALKEAVGEGAKTSLDDWAFPNWKPGADYTEDQYA
ncbi:MAG: ABC transporter substrate-binding protein [Micromonosporaceae bacterium]